MEDLCLARLPHLDEKRERTSELLRLSSTPIEIRVVDMSGPIGDVRLD